MSNILRLKRRTSVGAAGAPAALKTTEPAYNEADNVLYIGFGDDGSGNATSIKALAGAGAFLDLSTSQTVGGTKTFTVSPIVPTPAASDNSTKVATTAYVDAAVSSSSIPDGDKGDITVSGSGTTFTIDAGAVNNAKLANVGTSTIKGRATAGSGSPEDLTAAQVRTILNVADGANNYVHPTGDGNLHVPATSTTNNGEFLKAGATAGSIAWAPLVYADLTGTVPTWNQDTTGSAATLTTPRTISLTGPITGAVSFDGSGNVSIATTVAEAELAAIAGLASAANKIPYFTGSGTAALLTLDTDTALAANSDTNLASQKAVKAYVDGLISANDAMVFKGVINCSTNPNYPAANAGDTYRASVGGKIGGASGAVVEAGDIMLCITDGTAAGTQATVGANWSIIQTNIDGALTTADIGSSVQGYDAGLNSIAGLSTAADKGIYTSASDTYVTYTLTAGGRALAGVAGTANTAPYFSAANTVTLGAVTAGGRALWNVAGTSGTFPYFSAANTVSLGTITLAGRALLDDADAPAQRVTLGLGTIATQDASAVAITGGTIDGVTIDGGTF